MNWQLDEFQGKDVVFVGVGQGRAMSGIRAFLTKHASLKSFTGVDKQPGDKPLDFLLSYDPSTTIVIKNEGIPGTAMPVPYITPLQLFFRLVQQVGARTVGITGTKGKSTTAALAAHILETAGKPAVLAGNIGVSPFSVLDDATSESIFVLELSSYQLSDLQTSPHISACINLYNDHADWHGTQENYWEAKHNIMRFAGPQDVFIYNPDFSELRYWAEHASCRTVAINPNEPLDLSHAQLFGEHNRLNALVAREVARALHVPDDVSQQAINSFQPLEHRMEVVGVKSSRTYIDDAIGMTPESTLASMKAVMAKFGPVGCLLLGGQDREYDFSELMHFIAEQNVPNLVLFPNTEDKMLALLPDSYRPNILRTTSMAEAVQFGAKMAPENSVVLLSTAAPSYLLWSGFPEKGDDFQAQVAKLA